jgi:hypothetical protein
MGCCWPSPGAAIDKLVRIGGVGAGSPLLSVEIRQLGGELARSQPGGGVRSAIDAPYALFALGMAPTEQVARAIGAYVKHLISGMAPWAAEEMYMNFAETRRDPSSLWGEHAHGRLRQIKARLDPDDVIRSNHEIAPA